MCLVNAKILQNFEVEAVAKFIENGSVPNVVIFDDEDTSQPHIIKFFNSDLTKVHKNLFSN